MSVRGGGARRCWSSGEEAPSRQCGGVLTVKASLIHTSPLLTCFPHALECLALFFAQWFNANLEGKTSKSILAENYLALILPCFLDDLLKSLLTEFASPCSYIIPMNCNANKR